MKRSDELVAKILKHLSDADAHSIPGSRIRADLSQDGSATSELVGHHLVIMAGRGLISISNGGSASLTWEGHTVAEGKSGIDE